AWAQGRAHAIDEGRPYRFAVTAGGSDYKLSPDDDVADGGQADDGNGPRAFVIDDHLPKGVTFARVEEDGGQSQSSRGGMTTVAVLLADGPARDDAEVRFQVKGTLPKTIKLRGMTGGITVTQEKDGGGSR